MGCQIKQLELDRIYLFAIQDGAVHPIFSILSISGAGELNESKTTTLSTDIELSIYMQTPHNQSGEQACIVSRTDPV